MTKEEVLRFNNLFDKMELFFKDFQEQKVFSENAIYIGSIGNVRARNQIIVNACWDKIRAIPIKCQNLEEIESGHRTSFFTYDDFFNKEKWDSLSAYIVDSFKITEAEHLFVEIKNHENN